MRYSVAAEQLVNPKDPRRDTIAQAEKSLVEELVEECIVSKQPLDIRKIPGVNRADKRLLARKCRIWAKAKYGVII